MRFRGRSRALNGPLRGAWLRADPVLIKAWWTLSHRRLCCLSLLASLTTRTIGARFISTFPLSPLRGCNRLNILIWVDQCLLVLASPFCTCLSALTLRLLAFSSLTLGALFQSSFVLSTAIHIRNGTLARVRAW